MFKLWWKFRYAWHMNKISKCGLSFGWYNAGCHIENIPDEWSEENPIFSAEDEMSYWGE